MELSGTPAHRLPADVLAEWRRLERLLEAGVGDESEGALLARRIAELKSEYRAVIESIRDAPEPTSSLEPANGDPVRQG